MKYKCCQHLHSGLAFLLSKVVTCNYLYGGVVLYDSIAEGSNVDIAKIFERRKELIEKCKQGIYFEPCINCDRFVEADWDDNANIKYLSIFHWLHCNCSCVYCFQEYARNPAGGYSDEVVKSQYYDVYPILKFLKENNYLEEGKLNVEIGGGEPAILAELPDIISIISDIGFEFCLIMSSGIRYSEDIEKLIQAPHTQFSVTISAGSREVFKKIKRRDKFDVVKDNLKRYLENSPYGDNIKIRYLIYEGINDNEKDIKDWVDLCEEIGAKTLEITFEFCKSFSEKRGQPYSPHLDKLIDYYKEYANNKGIFNVLVDNTTLGIMERGHY